MRYARAIPTQTDGIARASPRRPPDAPSHPHRPQPSPRSPPCAGCDSPRARILRSSPVASGSRASPSGPPTTCTEFSCSRARTFGAFQRSSTYDWHIERFDYKREGKSLKLTFPQTGKTAEVTYTISACDNLPPFDLCLDLSDNPWGGPKRFYGKRRVVEDDADLKEMRAHLPAR